MRAYTRLSLKGKSLQAQGCSEDGMGCSVVRAQQEKSMDPQASLNSTQHALFQNLGSPLKIHEGYGGTLD